MEFALWFSLYEKIIYRSFEQWANHCHVNSSFFLISNKRIYLAGKCETDAQTNETFTLTEFKFIKIIIDAQFALLSNIFFRYPLDTRFWVVLRLIISGWASILIYWHIQMYSHQEAGISPMKFFGFNWSGICLCIRTLILG